MSIPDEERSCSAVSLLLFTRNLATMMRCGVPLSKCLLVLSRSTHERALAHVILDLNFQLQTGHKLSQSCACFPMIFSSTYLEVLRAGEVRGALDHSLFLLADWLEASQRIRRQMLGALLYPGLVLLMAGLMTLLASWVILPPLLQSLENSGRALPFPTHCLLALTGLLRQPFFLCLLLAVACEAWMNRTRWWNSPRFYAVIRAIPGLGPILHETALARLLATLAPLLTTGAMPTEAWILAARASSSPILRRHSRFVIQGLLEGQPIDDVLCLRPDLYPQPMPILMRVGQESGKLPELTHRLANYFESSARERVQAFAPLIEPFLLLGVAGAVLFVILGLFLPLYSNLNVS